MTETKERRVFARRSAFDVGGRGRPPLHLAVCVAVRASRTVGGVSRRVFLKERRATRAGQHSTSAGEAPAATPGACGGARLAHRRRRESPC